MDLNGDGREDIVSGSWPGQVFVFHRKKDGSFAAPVKLKTKSLKEVKPGNASAVFFVDWDGDGDLDLLGGNIGGAVLLYENLSGEGKTLSLAAGKRLEAAGKAIAAPGGKSAPCVADWDGDGDLDLLVGSGSGEVVLFRNKAGKGKPALAKGETLLTPKAGHAKRTKLCVTDWNGDGKLDLLVGDFSSKGRGTYHGYVWLYLRKGEPAKKVARNPTRWF